MQVTNQYPFSWIDMIQNKCTVRQLEQYAEADLGTMRSDTPENFIKKMIEIASNKGIKNPEIFIGVAYKGYKNLPDDMMPISTVQPPTEEVWHKLINGFNFNCYFPPHVYLVDKDKYKKTANLII